MMLSDVFTQGLLSNVFSLCFWFGTAATIVTFVLGIGHHGPLHLPHFGHQAPHAPTFGHASAGADAVSPFNLTSILAFLVVFGAIGLALQGGIGGIAVLILAVLAGSLAGWLAFLFIARFLVRGETYLRDDPLVGTIGTVSIPIGAGRVGEIIYARHGVRRSDGARSIDGQAINAGEEVVIVSYQNGIATVQRWQDLVDGPTGTPSRAPEVR